MRVIKRGTLEKFWKQYPDAKTSLESWYAVMRQATWKTPAEMKQVYHSADIYGRRTIFNIAGNKYRLIARVNYVTQRVYVLHVLTHAEYDKGHWKYDQHRSSHQ